MSQLSPIFNSWVPNWLIRTLLFLVILPVVAMLSGYVGGVNSAAGYYGLDPTDIQYSMVLYYAGIASFFSLERRFFTYFASKTYFLMIILLYTAINFVLYSTHDAAIFFIFRYLGGAVTVGIISVTLNLVFSQFHSERARVLGYTVFYGTLLISNAFSYLLDAYMFENFDFNVLYLAVIYLQIPGVVLMLLCLKSNIRLHPKRIPLSNLDWKSFLVYSVLLCLIGYVVLYGQYYGWFESLRIWACMLGVLILLATFILLQRKSKRPYIDLEVYKYRNFRIGLVLLIAFYISKGDIGVANGFFSSGLHLDPYHNAYMMFYNAIGIVVGIGITARFLLKKRNIQLIWLTGFGFLFVYHVQMFFLFGPQANEDTLFFPLFFQGMGNGILMLSIVLFTVAAVPPSLGFSASLTGVSYRFFAFTVSLAFIAFMNLRQGSVHYHELGNSVTGLNPESSRRSQLYEAAAMAKGASSLQSKVMAKRQLGKAVATHNNLLFARDYYFLMGVFIFIVMLSIALIPHFRYYLHKIGNRLIPI